MSKVGPGMTVFRAKGGRDMRNSALLVTRRVCCLWASALSVALGGCSPMGSDGEDTTPSSPTAAQLFTTVTQTDPYDQWAQFPDVQGTVASAAPHGPMARIFINAQVEQALDSFPGALPDGAIIVKENIGAGDSEKVEALTIMWKVADFDPANADWFWANITPEGQVNAEGQVAGCLSCHSSARDNDFVFVHQF